MNNAQEVAEESPIGHPISVVAARTGLSRDVLRVWERRYGAVEPTRTAGGQRLYSDEDVHRFRLLASATRGGRNISTVAALSTAELERVVGSDEGQLPEVATARVAPANFEASGSTAPFVDAALASVTRLDAPALDAQLRRSIARDGAPWFLEHAAPALMRAVGDGWVAGRISIAQEHLASAALVVVILDMMRALPVAPTAPRLLVATPSGERHAVGAALAAATAALEGWGVIYLGGDVPAVEIAAAAKASGASAVALSIVFVDDLQGTEREIAAVLSGVDVTIPLMLGGAGASALDSCGNNRAVRVFSTLGELKEELARTVRSA